MKRFAVVGLSMAALFCLLLTIAAGPAIAQDTAPNANGDQAQAAPSDTSAPDAAAAGGEPTPEDLSKISYVVGYQMGGSVKNAGIDVNLDELVRGIKDAVEGREGAVSEEEAMKVMTRLQGTIREKRQKEMAAQAADNQQKAEAFLAENAKAEGVKTTASGLQYKVVEEGSGPAPKDGDTVTVHYRGTLVDGKEFDSSYSRNEPATFKVGQMIPGFDEGLKLMKQGGKYQLFIPPDLGYGTRNMGPIPPNSLLKFDVELLKVEPAAESGGQDSVVLPMGQ
ncbi:MAG: FKBP-type peptidyl-prolyl cis-trans isomerase [Candidatus Hydrogenedentes bacterium]|nr:FKBP-type peptidyl-prolyl cis-trans isomerase [Candidatus Hydrogenedentota bacterium]